MITAMVRSKLLATSAITALVSTRIYVDSLPQSPTLPALSVHPVSKVPGKEVGKGIKARVQISCWSNPPTSEGVRSPAEVESVAAAVTAVFHKPRLNASPEKWTVGSVSYVITSCRVTGGTRIIKDPTNWYHIPLDVEISYNEV